MQFSLILCMFEWCFKKSTFQGTFFIWHKPICTLSKNPRKTAQVGSKANLSPHQENVKVLNTQSTAQLGKKQGAGTRPHPPQRNMNSICNNSLSHYSNTFYMSSAHFHNTISGYYAHLSEGNWLKLIQTQALLSPDQCLSHYSPGPPQ